MNIERGEPLELFSFSDLAFDACDFLESRRLASMELSFSIFALISALTDFPLEITVVPP